MGIEIYYKVESQFWRRKIDNKLEDLLSGKYSDSFLNMTKEFHHESPLKARKMAFEHYQSIIDVLYDGLGKEYTTDYQARIDLQYYFDSGNYVELMKSNPEKRCKMTKDDSNGIVIYMVIEKTYKYSGEIRKKSTQYDIHGVTYRDYLDRLDWNILDYLRNLIFEQKYYREEYKIFSKPKAHRFEKGDVIAKCFSDIGGDVELLIATPFDWDKFSDDFRGYDLIED